jgi:glycogen operon protein
MPAFAGWWEGSEIDDLRALGALDEASARAAHAQRDGIKDALVRWLREQHLLHGPATAAAVLHAVLRELARGPSRAMIVALEDLWGEKRPQNVPGTWRERPNWQRRMARTRAEIEADARLADVVRELARRGG